jgi:hypothetical protein
MWERQEIHRKISREEILNNTKRWLKDNIKINLIEIMCEEIFEKTIVYVYI